MTTQNSAMGDEELREIACTFANRIGSPHGEGATYSHDQAVGDEEDRKPNGRLYSHLNNDDFDRFVNDFIEAIKSRDQQIALAAQSKGHWFKRRYSAAKIPEHYGYDSEWRYVCNCDHEEITREALDGHVNWHIATLNQAQNKEK